MQYGFKRSIALCRASALFCLFVALCCAVMCCAAEVTEENDPGTLTVALRVQAVASGGQQLYLAGGGQVFRDRLSGEQGPTQIFRDPDLHIAAIAADGDVLAIAGTANVEYGMAGLLDAHGKVLWRNAELESRAICVAAGGECVTVGCEDGSVLCFKRSSGELLWQQRLHAKMVTAICLVDAQTVASGDWTGKIILADLADGELRAAFSQHRDRITDLRILSDADGRVSLFSSSVDGTARLWSPAQERLVRFVQVLAPIRRIWIESPEAGVAILEGGSIVAINLSESTVKTLAARVPAGTCSIVEYGGWHWVANGTQSVSRQRLGKRQ